MIDSKYKNIFIQLIEQGDFDQALLLGNELSQAFPDDPEGYNMVADAFRLKGDFSSAQKFYSLSLVKNRQQPHIMIMLGEVYISLGLVHEADTSFCDALELAPDDSHVLYKCGFYYMGKGESESAEYLFNRAVDLGLEKAYNGLLDLYVFNNDQKKIKQLLDEKIQSIPKGSLSIGRAYNKIKLYQEAFDYLDSIVLDNKSPPWMRCYYNLLGSTLDSLKRYQEAFVAYEQQNKHTLSDYSAEDEEVRLKTIIEYMEKNAERIDKSSAFKSSPLFILGTPRSGSSLIEQILNVNDHVALGGELNFIASAYNTWASQDNNMVDIAQWYREKLEFYINENPQKSSVKWVTDKMPANWQYIEFILKLVPDAKIIYSKRNAMDIGLSIFKQNLISAHPYATKLEDIAHHIHLVDTTMADWIKKYPQQIMTVEYESLIENFDAQTKQLMIFLDLDWTEELKQFHDNKQVTLTASRDQVKDPLYASSIHAFKRYGEKLDSLKSALDHYNIKFQ